MGRYQTPHELYCEAETIARDAGLLERFWETFTALERFIFFRQKDYISSGSLFRSDLDLYAKGRRLSPGLRLLGCRQESNDSGTLQRGTALAGGVA